MLLVIALPILGDKIYLVHTSTSSIYHVYDYYVARTRHERIMRRQKDNGVMEGMQCVVMQRVVSCI